MKPQGYHCIAKALTCRRGDMNAAIFALIANTEISTPIMRKRYPRYACLLASIPRLCVNPYPRYAWKSTKFHGLWAVDDFRLLFAYPGLHVPGTRKSKRVVVQCKGCRENIPAPVEYKLTVSSEKLVLKISNLPSQL